MSRKLSVVTGAAFVLGLAAALVGCGTKQISLSNMWRDPAYTQGPMQKLMVIAIKRDPIRRRLWEDQFAADMAKRGVTVTPSYRLFPDAVPDTLQVVDTVREHKFDGVMTVRNVGTSTVTSHVPGYVTTEPVSTYNYHWPHGYYTYYREVYQPGYTEVQDVARHEIHLWTTTEGGRIVWAGTGQVIDPGSVEDVQEEIADLVIPELEKQRLIPEKS
jgi:hypothetical protein